jgi:putative transposase
MWSDGYGCWAAASSAGCVGEFEEVVDGADHCPLGSDLIEAAEEELAKASGLLHLPEYGFDYLLAQPVTASSAGPLVPRGNQGGS